MRELLYAVSVVIALSVGFVVGTGHNPVKVLCPCAKCDCCEACPGKNKKCCGKECTCEKPCPCCPKCPGYDGKRVVELPAKVSN